jgi:predicted RNA-binding protein YlqC (UPF0109 family)
MTVNRIGLVYEALLQVTHAVLNYPEEARITVRALDKLIAFRIWVALRDRGKSIGKHGQTIHAILAIASVFGKADNLRFTVEIEDA